MISQLKIYCTKNTYPYRNLAIEEYLTTHVQAGELILYLWQNAHTVVIGRNQNAWQECRVSALEAAGGHLVRRLSGGGAVYHDLGNLNFTFCVKKADYDVAKQLDVILAAVQKLGIAAQKTGRNDITVEGRKFSGNAFYQTGDNCYHHGTLLLHTDTAMMTQYLNVDRAKLQAKGVSSVKSRVTNLNAYHQGLTPELMTKKLCEALCEVYNCPLQTIADSELDKVKIAQLEAKFSDWNWLFGRKIPFTHQIKQRFSWGDIQFYLAVNAGKITHLDIYSDMMEQDIILSLKAYLQDCPYVKQTILTKAAASFAANISPQIKQDILALLSTQL